MEGKRVSREKVIFVGEISKTLGKKLYHLSLSLSLSSPPSLLSRPPSEELSLSFSSSFFYLRVFAGKVSFTNQNSRLGPAQGFLPIVRACAVSFALVGDVALCSLSISFSPDESLPERVRKREREEELLNFFPWSDSETEHLSDQVSGPGSGSRAMPFSQS